MTIAYDTGPAVTSSATASTTIESASFAISSGSDRVLIVGVANSGSSPAAPTAVKWGGSGGTSLTQVGSTVSTTNGRVTMWRLAAPTAQTSTVHVTWAGNQDERELIVLVYTGVDQTTVHRTPGTATGADPSTAPTVNATTTAADVVVDIVGVVDTGGANPGLTVGASQASRGEIESGTPNAYVAAGMSEETAAGASVTMSWTISTGSDWGIIAAPLIPSAGTVYQYARPSTTITTGDWSSTGTATLWGAVDETAATVADYISTGTLAGGSAAWADLGFTDLAAVPATDGDHKVRVHARSPSGHSLQAILCESGGTAIATGVFTAMSATWTTYEFTLTSAQAASIGSYAGLRLKLKAMT